MAQYKVLQDIEAEDKLLGPLSLRQFIYAVVVVVLGFVAFKLGTMRWYLVIPFVPPMIFFGLLAAPLGRDQPSEVWLLAKIRFFTKARRRIWDQAGVKELVTITVPKKIERVVGKGFSQQEKSSRLKALAATLDTRGWAVKNIDAATYQRPILAGNAPSDRLVDITSVPDDASAVDPESDILDEANNPVAQKVEQTLESSTQTHREELLQKVRKIADEQKQPDGPRPLVPAAPSTDNDNKKLSPQDQAVWDQIQMSRKNNLATANMRQLPSTQHAEPSAKPQPDPTAIKIPRQTAVTPPSDPGILKLVKNNDLNVETVGREANRKKDKEPPQDEVVIPLR